MFPNVRLMIVALLASVVTLSCGFGVFAAFRVNHEPLTRLRAGPAPLQLIADYAGPTSVAAATVASFDSRFRQRELPSPVAMVGPEPEPAPAPAIIGIATAELPSQDAETIAADEPDNNGATVAAIEPVAVAAAPIVPQKAVTAGKAVTAKVVRKTASRQRVAARTHLHRRARPTAVALATDQTSTFAQQGFQSAQQPVQGQAVARRRRPAKKAIARRTIVKQTAVGGPFVRPPSH